jgi:hemoglobin-like flavoprotein
MFATGGKENGKQAERLSAPILAYVDNIHHLDPLAESQLNATRTVVGREPIVLCK